MAHESNWSSNKVKARWSVLTKFVVPHGTEHLSASCNIQRTLHQPQITLAFRDEVYRLSPHSRSTVPLIKMVIVELELSLHNVSK